MNMYMQPFVLAPALVATLASAHVLQAQESTPLEGLASEARVAELRLKADVDGAPAALAVLRADLARLESAIEATESKATHDALQLIADQLYKVKAEIAGVDGDALTQDQVENSVQAVVVKAFRTGETERLETFGTMIAPEVEAIARAAQTPPELLNYPGLTPLGWLMIHAPERGMPVAHELLARPGENWMRAVAKGVAFGFWPKETLLDTDGAPQPEAMALYEAIVRAPGVASETRVNATRQWLGWGVDTPLVREQAIRDAVTIAALTGSSRRVSYAVEFSRNPWWAKALLAQDDVDLRLLGMHAIFEESPPLELILQLASDPSERVRSSLATHIGEHVGRKRSMLDLPFEEVWIGLFQDDSQTVRQSAYEAILAPSSSQRAIRLGPDGFVALLTKLQDENESRPLGRSLSAARKGLSDSNKAWRREHVAALVRVFESASEPIASASVRALSSASRDAKISAMVLAEINWSDWTKDRWNPAGNLKAVEGLASKDKMRLFGELMAKPDVPKDVLNGVLSGTFGKGEAGLHALAPADAVRTLIAASRRVDLALVGPMFRQTDWSTSTKALQQVAQSNDRTPFERAIASAALAAEQPPTKEMITQLVDGIARVCTSMDSDQDAPATVGLLSAAFETRNEASLQLLTALLDEPLVSTEAVTHYYGVDFAEESLDRAAVAQCFDAMEARILNVGATDRSHFRNLDKSILAAMEKEATLFRPALAEHFGKLTRHASEFYRATMAANAIDVIEIVRQYKWDELRKGGSSYSVTNLFDQLTALGQAEAIPALLDYAQNGKFTKLREEALTRVNNYARIRELQSMVTDPSVPTRQSAAVEVAALLDEEEIALRVEGMRALAALGAVEYIPQIVEVLRTTVSANERAAARKALDRLYEAR